MHFSFKELESYFIKDLPSVKEVVETLTNYAFEVDGLLEKSDGDFDLDIKVLPDRANDAKNALGMARELSTVLKLPLKDDYNSLPTTKDARAKISFLITDINNLVGVEFSKEDIISYLLRVRVVVESNDDEFIALIPVERTDLNIKEDLADEVARLFGYANLVAKPLPDQDKELVSNSNFNLANQLRQFFVEKYFTEIHGYTFVQTGEIEIEKPLASDKAFLRTNLSDGMEKYLKLNLGHILFEDDVVQLFEIGTAFPKKDQEEKSLCLGVAYNSPKLNKSEQRINEIITDLEKNFDVDKKSFNITKGENFTTAEIKIKELKGKADSINLMSLVNKNISYKPFSVYPKMTRDIALFVPEGVSALNVAKKISSLAGDLLIFDPVLFDEFHKEGRVSYAFRLVFQSSEKTLSDGEINPIVADIEAGLETQKDFEIRR